MTTKSKVGPKVKLSFLSLTVGAGIWQLAHSFLPTIHPEFAAAAASSSAAPPILEKTAADPNVFAQLAKRAVPSVVNISVSGPVQVGFNPGLPGRPSGPQGLPPGLPEEFFHEFFGGQVPGNPVPGRPRGSMRRTTGLGTGFVIDPSGIIMTNHHVIANAKEIKVQLTESENDPPLDAKVLGQDPDLDIALLQVQSPKPLAALPLGDSEALEVGEYVMAVGNPFGQGHSVSHGIVSAKGRLIPNMPMAKYLQTDAPINPGNSGGPLLNLRGEVIGINNAIDARAQGISFAIPINFAKAVLTQLKTNGHVARGYIGAEITQLTPEIAEQIGFQEELKAPVIARVTPFSPAAKAGLRANDIVTEINTNPVHSTEEMIGAIATSPVGSKIPIEVIRAGKKVKLEVTLAARPQT